MEHANLLQAISRLGYTLDDAYLLETLRDGTIKIALSDTEKFTDILENLGGSEILPVLYFAHPNVDQLDGPGSVIKLTLSHHSFSGSF